jgi:hypothetical protein
LEEGRKAGRLCEEVALLAMAVIQVMNLVAGVG